MDAVSTSGHLISFTQKGIHFLILLDLKLLKLSTLWMAKKIQLK
jgi:hypothetical protein